MKPYMGTPPSSSPVLQQHCCSRSSCWIYGVLGGVLLFSFFASFAVFWIGFVSEQVADQSDFIFSNKTNKLIKVS